MEQEVIFFFSILLIYFYLFQFKIGIKALSEEKQKKLQQIYDLIVNEFGKKDTIFIDGGTNSGVMKMMGNSKKKLNEETNITKTKLIGVVPKKVILFLFYFYFILFLFYFYFIIIFL